MKIFLAVILTAAGSFIGVSSLGFGADLRNQADKIVVEKSKHRLMLYKQNEILKTYQVALGRNPQGHKQSLADNRTPEGLYRIDWRNAHSHFHRALHISYPNPRDLAAARENGVKLGGDIMVHGLKNGLGWIGPLHRLVDWTQGCIAVTDPEIEEIWKYVPDGTLIEIKP